MKVVRWNPGFTMRWLNEFDRHANKQLRRPSWYADTNMGLAVDVIENDEDFVVKATVPGINPEDVDITFEEGILTIKGELVEENKQEEVNYHIRERWTGAFGRRLRFPVDIDAEAIEATYENGILTLNVPKVEEAQPKRIEVKVA